MQLLSQSKTKEIEKQAMPGGVGKVMQQLSKGDDFLSGLAGPIVNTYGGLQKLMGYGRQLPALYKNPKTTRDVLLKDNLFAQGAKDIRRGNTLRTRAGLQNIFNTDKSIGYRLGRGVGAGAIGAPIVFAPFTLSSYLGAANADPQLAQEYAKNRAYDRVESRLNQFSEMPFLDRIQTVLKPEKFSENLNSPAASDIYENLANNNINNPGILKYLSSFNPFITNPDEVIKQRVRSEVLRNMQSGKSASELTKQANILKHIFTNVLQPAYSLGKQYRGLPMNAKLPKALRDYNKTPGQSYLENLAGNYAMNLGKNPVLTSLGTLGAAYTAQLPFAMRDSYQAGKNNVYNEAGLAAEGLADLGIMDKFNQPGFMGGLGRAGMAIAPGMGRDMILKQIRQSMFPELNRQQY
jgi:hypothetical protein